MILRSQQRIGGFEAMKVRALLRRLTHDFWTTVRATREMNVTLPSAKKLIAALRSSGYAEQVPGQPKGVWRNTIAGNALASSTAARPIHRQTGENRLVEFLERVRLLNADDEWAYRVTKVVVFGSYLTRKSRLGDVDVAIRLESRSKYQNRWPDVLLEQAEEGERCAPRILYMPFARSRPTGPFAP